MRALLVSVLLGLFARPAHAGAVPAGAPPETVRIAELVDATYLPAAKLDPVLEKRGFARLAVVDRSVEEVANGQTMALKTFLFAAVATQDSPGLPKGTLVVAIRGSHTANDWWTNFHMKLVAWQAGDHAGCGRLHEGFLSVAGVALSSETVMRAIRSRPRVVLAGHSLGGAAAVIVGAHLVEMGLPVGSLRVITFGAPKPGNEEFATRYSGRLDHHEFRNRRDPLFDAPPSKAFFHLCDVHGGRYFQIDERSAWANANDHHMWNYVYNLGGFDTDILSARFDIPAASIRLPFTVGQKLSRAGSNLASSVGTKIREMLKRRDTQRDPPRPPPHSSP